MLALTPIMVLMFPVFATAALVMKRRTSGDPDRAWKHAFTGTPSWVGPVLLGLFAYTGFNFLFSLLYLNEGLSPELQNGQFVLQSHGRTVRMITEAEYHRHKAIEVRGISTHLLFFHVLGSAVLWSEVLLGTSKRNKQ